MKIEKIQNIIYSVISFQREDRRQKQIEACLLHKFALFYRNKNINILFASENSCREALENYRIYPREDYKRRKKLSDYVLDTAY